MTYNSGPLWLLILIFLWSVFTTVTGYCGEEEDGDDDQLVEGLAEYYDALKDADKSSLIGQEETFKNKYGIQTWSDAQLTKMKNSTTSDMDHIIMGVASYRLLENLEYQ